MSALRAGQMLEGTPYQVVRELGAGGMGVVYEVQHVRLKKHYVAKIIHEQIRGEDGAQKRMEREADVLGKINHPNIVQVHDVGSTPDGTSYFIMEKLEGLDLRQAMKRSGIGRSRAIGIVIDVLDALEHVHRRGIVHRDIKPENIFLAQQANGIATKVLDFGIVHIFDRDGKSSHGRITKTGGFVGTLYYAAPEQMQGKPATPPNDVYAAGLVLFELVARRGPFDDDPGVGLSRCFKPAPRLDAVGASTVSPELADAVASALEQDPEKRPSAAELATRLRHVLATATTDPGYVEHDALRADVDDLLLNLPLQSIGGGPTAEAPPTNAPPTPLMQGAPARFASIDVDPTVASAMAPAAHLHPASLGPTVMSGASLTPTPADPANATVPTLPRAPSSVPDIPLAQGTTAPGLYATVEAPTRRASGFAFFGALATFVAVIGLATTVIVSVVRSATKPAPTTAAAAATTTIAAVAAPPEPVTVTTTTPPAPSPPPSTSASVSASSAPPPPRAATKPGAAPPKGNAKKDGYVENL